MELTAKMFGGYINFTWNPSSKKLTLVRNVHGPDEPEKGETVLLWTYNQRPEIELITDPNIGQWISDFTYSTCKQVVGEARSKFQSIAGPGSGTSMNGDALKAESKEEIEQLLEDLRNFVDASDALTWIMG